MTVLLQLQSVSNILSCKRQKLKQGRVTYLSAFSGLPLVQAWLGPLAMPQEGCAGWPNQDR